MNYPVVSIIIPTLNEEKNIGRCLESIKKQTYPQDRVEIIGVDNNSTDKTKEIVEKFIKLKSYKGDKENKPSTLKTLNSSNFTNFMNFQTNNLIGLHIPEVILGDSYWCKVRNFERSFYDAIVIDCVRFLPKKVWEKVGGFDARV